MSSALLCTRNIDIWVRGPNYAEQFAMPKWARERSCCSYYRIPSFGRIKLTASLAAIFGRAIVTDTLLRAAGRASLVVVT